MNLKKKNFILIAFGFVIALMAILYIVQGNSLTTAGYYSLSESKRVVALRATKTALELKLAEIKSFTSLEETAADLGMVEPQTVSYLSLTSEVAVK